MTEKSDLLSEVRELRLEVARLRGLVERLEGRGRSDQAPFNPHPNEPLKAFLTRWPVYDMGNS